MSDIPSTTSISAAAQAYQLAMAQQATSPAPPAAPENKDEVEQTPDDTVMNDIAVETPSLPVPTISESAAPTASAPILPRMGTPARLANGGDGPSSRATSQHPEPTFAIPTEAPPHGAPARQYLNSKVTAALLEGMKQLAKEKPKDPLRVLGEFLLQRSREQEGR